MGLNVEAFGLDAIAKTMDSMVTQIHDLGAQKTAPELTEWQEQDMRRRYPNTKQEDDKTVSTEIWPRSRVTQKKRPPGRFTRPPRVFYAKPLTGGKALLSIRPILRAELFDILCQRMAALMSQELKWKV